MQRSDAATDTVTVPVPDHSELKLGPLLSIIRPSQVLRLRAVVVGLSLPVKSERGTLAAIEVLLAGLTSVIAGQLQAGTPWTFYEELDVYLGPWGVEGYDPGSGRGYFF